MDKSAFAPGLTCLSVGAHCRLARRRYAHRLESDLPPHDHWNAVHGRFLGEGLPASPAWTGNRRWAKPAAVEARFRAILEAVKDRDGLNEAQTEARVFRPMLARSAGPGVHGSAKAGSHGRGNVPDYAYSPTPNPSRSADAERTRGQARARGRRRRRQGVERRFDAREQRRGRARRRPARPCATSFAPKSNRTARSARRS